MTKISLRWLLPSLLLLAGTIRSQDDRPPVTRTYFIDSAFVVTQPGQVIALGGVIVRNGLIEAVGKNLTAPADARVLEGDSLYIYAGFIDGLSYAGVPKPAREDDRPDVKDPGNPSYEVAGIQPDRSVLGVMDAGDKSITELRALGFTAAHVVPRGRMLPGQGAVVLLDGDSPEAMLLRPQTSLFAQFQGARGVYPATTMAIMAKWRELYRRAEGGKDHSSRYARSARGMGRPAYDEVLEAFYPVIDGDRPVFFAVDDIKEVHRALGLARELNFSLALANLGRGQLVMDRLRDGKTPLFLRLELPEAKDAKAKKTDDDSEDPQAENTVQPGVESARRLEARRATAMREFEEQAGLLAGAGIPFGFSSAEVKTKDIRGNLNRMIAAGLTADQALAALTTHPAQLLGLDGVMGTVEAGKIANLVVTDKPYFEEGANIRYVFVDGTPTTYEVKKKKERKPGDPAAVVTAAGEWALEIDVPGQQTNSVLTLSGSADDLSGALSVGDDETAINDVELDGNTLTFTSKFDMNGQTATLSWDLTIEGDNLEGTVSVGAFGTFDVDGTRTSGPEEN